MTKAEKAHLTRVAALGCIVCRRLGIHDSPAEIHHPRTSAGLGHKATHFEALPFCPNHHRNGPDALHVMGRKAWEAHFGFTELELLAQVREMLT
jgi:Recombination enhancement, RecA-dependent nuclease